MTISRIYKQHLRKIEEAKKELAVLDVEVVKKEAKSEKLDKQISLKTSSITDMNERLIESKNLFEEKVEILKNTVITENDALDTIKEEKDKQLNILNKAKDESKKLKETSKRLGKEIVNLREAKDNFNTDLNSILEKINTSKTENGDVIKDATKKLLSVTKKLEKAETKLEKAEIKHKEIMKDIGRENEIFSQREKDVVILESRLKKKYPKENLVLQVN